MELSTADAQTNTATAAQDGLKAQRERLLEIRREMKEEVKRHRRVVREEMAKHEKKMNQLLEEMNKLKI